MSNPEHLKILKQGVEIWNKWREKNPTIHPNLNRAKLRGMKLEGINLSMANVSGANLSKADLSDANLTSANLSKADLSVTELSGSCLSLANLVMVSLAGAGLNAAILTGADLRSADLLGCGLWFANLEEANLKDADLRLCQLTHCILNGSVLTGTKLFGTARDDWKIKGVKCEYVYWDWNGEQRSPKDRDLEPGEFERLYAALPTIEYIFESGMLPIDPVIMDRVVQSIQHKQPEFDIKIDSINARGLAPSIKFTVQQEEHKEPALEAVRTEYEIKLKQLESERDRYYQLLGRALDAPKEIKLINAAPGSIVATDGSTVSIENHIHNALELQKAIANEPQDSESFAKVAKKTALDIVGETMKDIAKGQVKRAAKQIIELGKDLGPIITQTAAYTFFKSMIT